MSSQDAIDVARGAMIMALTLGGPALVVVLLVGVVISVFQAMTQINEATLSFVPKVVALAVLLVVLGPWMLQYAVTYTVTILTQLATAAH